MDAYKFDINELMDIHQLNNYIKQHNLTDRQLSKKEYKITKIIKFSSCHYYFYYLPTDIKNIIIDLLYPSDYFTNNHINECFTDINGNFQLHKIENYRKQIIIKFKELNKFCILSQKTKKILFNSYDIHISRHSDINIDIDNIKLHIKQTYGNSFSIICIGINLEFKLLYQN